MGVPNKEQAKALLDQYDAIRIRNREILSRALQYREKLWGLGFEKPEDEEKFWAEAEAHPIKFRARFADMTAIFNRAAKIPEGGGGSKPSERVTPEKLEEMGLTDAQIEKLAVVNGEQNSD